MSNSSSQKVFVHDYPEAGEKKRYYERIISELEGYESAASSDLQAISQGTKRSSVENTTSAGPYYDTFITQKEKWFDDLAEMRKELDFFVGVIGSRLDDARRLRDEWANKENMGHWEYT